MLLINSGMNEKLGCGGVFCCLPAFLVNSPCNKVSRQLVQVHGNTSERKIGFLAGPGTAQSWQVSSKGTRTRSPANICPHQPLVRLLRGQPRQLKRCLGFLGFKKEFYISFQSIDFKLDKRLSLTFAFSFILSCVWW